ncbi:hypothetical protein ABZ942_34610 [Nocardia sp. NPDC046473]|uniref:hypothetical protein n=1 Tax=Nocardia sp. NPDC046473 TaxID=3155733 RepID=UPI0033F34F67
MIATGKITGTDAHNLPGVPGRWSTNDAGALTATAADGVRINDTLDTRSAALKDVRTAVQPS